MNELIDVFKEFKVMQRMVGNERVQKKGNVKQVQQKQIGRNVIHIEGLVSTVNYIKIPKDKCSLKLNYQYLYLQLITIGNLYGFTFTCLANHKLFKLSFSTIYKKIKIINQYHAQITLRPATKWSLLCIDLKSFVSLFEIQNVVQFQVQSIEINASVKIKSIWASNNFYEVNSLPKQLNFAIGKKELFFERFEYMLINKDSCDVQPKSKKQKKQQHKNKEGQLKKQNKGININKTQQFKALLAQKQQEPIPFTHIPQPVHQQSQQKYSIKLQSVAGSASSILGIPFLFSIGKIIVTNTGSVKMTPSKIHSLHQNNKTIVASHINGQISIYDKQFSNQGYFATGLQQILDADLNQNVFILGKDKLHRTILMGIQKDKIQFRKVSNFNIQRIKLIKNLIISCGKEAIVIWSNIKNKSKQINLKPKALFLGEHARDNIFNDISYLKETNRVLIASSRGNIYIIDPEKQQIISALKIHQDSIQSIIAGYYSQYVLSCGYQGKIKLWKPDFTQQLMQLPIQSRISRLRLGSQGQIYALHLNHTIGMLSISQKKYRFISRCHSNNIVKVGYHRVSKRLVSISQDMSIKIWKLIKKKHYQIDQLYQFKVLDQCITTLAMAQHNNLFACGFEKGTIRIFDIIKQYLFISFVIVKQHNYHQGMVICLQFGLRNNLLISSDQMGIVSLTDDQGNIRSLQIEQSNKISCGFNSVGDQFFVQIDNQIQIYYTNSLQLKCFVRVDKNVFSVIFRQDLLVFSQPSSLTHYKTTGKNMELIRQFRFLHQNQMADKGTLILSWNDLYTFSLVQKLRISVLGSMKAQCFNAPEQLDGIQLSQDQENLIFGWGNQNYCIYIFSFEGQLYKNKNQIKSYLKESQGKRGCGQVKVQQRKITSVGRIQCQVQTKQNRIQEIPQSKQIKSIYHQIQGMMQFPTIHPQKVQPHHHLQVIQQEQKYSQKGDHFQLLKVLGYTLPRSYKGIPFKFPWIKPWLIMPIQKGLIFNKISEPLKQYFYQTDQINSLSLSPSNNYVGICTSVALQIIEVSSHKLLKRVKIIGNRLVWSKCQNYLLIQGKDFIAMVQVHSSKVITSTKIQNVVAIQWNKLSYGIIEWAICKQDKIQFWRMTPQRTLQFQQVQTEINTVHKYGEFICLQFVLLGNKVHLLCGTKLGSIIIIDARTATLVLIAGQLIQGPIVNIRAQFNHLTLLSSNINIYCWQFEFKNIQTLINAIQNKPQIITIDSMPVGVSQNFVNQLQFLILGRSGVTWFVDYEKMVSIKVICSHQFVKTVTDLAYLQDTNQSALIISSATDNTIKITALDNLSLKCQLLSPNSNPLCLTLLGQIGLLVTGHSDGQVRFFSLVTFQYLGNTKMSNSVTAIKQLGNRNLLIGNEDGQVWISLVKEVEHNTKGQLEIQICKIAQKIQGGIKQIRLCNINPLQTWLLTTKKGKLNVWNRKNVKRVPGYQFLSKIYQLEYYLIDNFRLNYQKTQENTNRKSNAILAEFTQQNHTIIITANQYSGFIIRNYKQHVVNNDNQNIKQIKWNCNPESFLICNKGRYIIVGDSFGKIILYDSHNGVQIDRAQCSQSGIKRLKVWQSIPQARFNKGISFSNQSQMIVLGSSGNQIYFFKLK